MLEKLNAEIHEFMSSVVKGLNWMQSAQILYFRKQTVHTNISVHHKRETKALASELASRRP